MKSFLQNYYYEVKKNKKKFTKWLHHKFYKNIIQKKYEVISSIDMYNYDVGKRFMKKKGTLTSATLYFTS